jgi:hypothetical protein
MHPPRWWMHLRIHLCIAIQRKRCLLFEVPFTHVEHETATQGAAHCNHPSEAKNISMPIKPRDQNSPNGNFLV